MLWDPERGLPIDRPLGIMLETRELQHIKTEIEARLRELQIDAGSGGESFSNASLRDLRAFLDMLPLARRPAIFLHDNGNLRALWKNEAKEQVGLQFLGNGEVQFVIFSQRQNPPVMTREAGVRPLSEIRALIAEMVEAESPRFSLDRYEMQRDPGETDEGYEARRRLFTDNG
jgi:hypothetical protein